MKILSGEKPNLDIVNFENLNQVIVELEEILNEYNVIEQDLVVKHLIERMNNKKRKLQASDIIGNISFGSLFKRAKKETNKGDDENEN